MDRRSVHLALSLSLAVALSAALLPLRAATSSDPISTVAGDGGNASTGEGGPAVSASIRPTRVAVDRQGNVYVAEAEDYTVRRITPLGNITRVAGTPGMAGGTGDGGPATLATLDMIADIAADADGNLYIADRQQNVVRRVGTDGNITRFAGGGSGAGNGDGGPATSVRLAGPSAIAFDATYVYIAEFQAARVRRVDVQGNISTVAGTGVEVQGGSGIGGPAAQAGIGAPVGLATDGQGNLYILDFTNQMVWRIGPDGNIQPHAGGGSSFVEGGPALRARFLWAWAIAADGPGNVFVADATTQRVYRIDAASRTRNTLAGTGVAGFGGDGGPAGSAQLARPLGVGHDAGANVYIADTGNHRVRKVTDRASTIDLRLAIEPLAESVTLGRPASFALTVTNNGPGPIGRFVVGDQPGDAEVTEISATSGSCTLEAAECELLPLPAGQSAMVSVALVPALLGRYCNSGYVYAPVNGDPDFSNNTATARCIDVVAPFALREFVALAEETLRIGPRSTIVSGALGSNTRTPGPLPEVELTGPSAVGPGTFVLGQTVRLDRLTVPRLFTEEEILANGGRAFELRPPGSFPAVALPPLPATASGAVPVDVPANEVRRLPPGAYGVVNVQAGGTLVLQGWSPLFAARAASPYHGYDFRKLELQAGAKLLVAGPPPTTQRLRLGAPIRIQENVVTARGATIAPMASDGAIQASHIVLYVEGGDVPVGGTVGAVVIGSGNKLHANIYAPHGELVLGSGTDATGAFIARKIRALAVRLTLDSAFR